ncbi:TRAP transporter small permease [Vibrio sp. NTOU-M3]|uniref:TRAP transporter small permease n=1 Tax=Vibrio sp. NTOU-M3 TaxID=3234954 RepID=UPI0035A8D37F
MLNFVCLLFNRQQWNGTMNITEPEKLPNQSRGMGIIASLSIGIEKFLSVISVTTLVLLCGVVLLQIFARLFLETPPVWTEELSRYLFIFLVASSVGIAYRRGELVSVDLFYNALSDRGALIYRFTSALFIASFCIILIPYAIQFAMIGKFQSSPTMYFPMSYVFYCTVIILGNIALFATLSFIKACLELLDKRVS